MNILVVGSGGREHALCWALSRSASIFCAPGNPGTASVGTNLPIDPSDQDGVVGAVANHGIDLTVIGPEAPLAAGLVDRLEAAGYKAFGPRAAPARIEASKIYAKEIMTRAGVPTASAMVFTDVDRALAHIADHPEPLVVKASGLAAGKGAVVCESRQDAAHASREILGGKFGRAGDQILVEEFLDGEELSVLALTDGDHVMLLPPSQDHKRLEEGDKGPNTGGMGAYAPVQIATEELLGRVLDEIIKPVLATMADDGAPYRGVLYAGIIVDSTGQIRNLEFNCRFGDPEAQVVLPTSDVDLAEHMWQIAAGERWRPDHWLCQARGTAVTTVLAAPGYPIAPIKGAEIVLPSSPPRDTILFHAGTTRGDDGVLRAAGGRVLCATGVGDDVKTAVARSRALAEAITFEGGVFRRDIAWREVARAGAA
jgi:phosphoribosylamine--glycine ligase